MLKALKLRWVSLVDPCVSSGLVLWEDTKILANWGDLTNIQDGRWKRMHQLLRHSLLSLPVRAYTNCLGKRHQEIIQPNLEDTQCSFHPGHIIKDEVFTLQHIFNKFQEYVKDV